MNILILGGTGVLSSDIVLKCASEGNNVFLITRGNNPIPNNPRIHSIKGNARNLEAIQDEISNVEYDVVIDFLSVTKQHIEYSYSHLANLCKQFVFISSACVFRRSSEDGIISEDSPKPNKQLDYSIQKLECEDYILSNHQDYKCKYTIVRPYITYGNTRIPVGVAPLAKYHWTIIGRILSNKPFFVWNDGENKCTLMHTNDFAYNFYQLLLNPKAYDEDFNIVGDEVHTWNEVIDMLFDICGKNPSYLKIPVPDLCAILPDYAGFIKGDRSLNAEFDNTKLKKAISDYKQVVCLRDGISRTIDFYKRHNYLNGIDYRFDGDIDKLINAFNGQAKFCDYLGEATIYDKFDYLTHRFLARRISIFTDKIIDKLRKI